MSDTCPVCDAEEYSDTGGCDKCGHYNEDQRHRKSKRNRRNDRWVENHRPH